jgi:hypothetical protein
MHQLELTVKKSRIPIVPESSKQTVLVLIWEASPQLAAGY